ncbi:MAG TPA: aldehyde dehydrogenase family protein [Bryobacteraceae bacterium]|nr:aldehyde dehydrogenase family protein [Bryobacteraceae bacterium]
MSLEFKNLINGEWVPASSGKTFQTHNPADFAQAVGTYPSAPKEDAERAFTAAEAALPAWRNMPAPKRGEILYKAAELLAARVDQLAKEMTTEEGKTFPEAKGEVMRAINIFRYFGGEGARLNGETVPSERDGVFCFTIRKPRGVVSLITPWNFPIAIPAWKMAPALVCGNTVVIKPAALAPSCTFRLAEALVEAGLPKGVLNVVTGSSREIGDTFVNHPSMRAISFTGSCGVGDHIYSAVAPRKLPAQLEMGGKNPTIVLKDADLEYAVDTVMNAAFASTGQKCTATSRAIVEAGIYDQFVSRIVEKTKGLKIGDGMEAGVYMGPCVDESQMDTVLGYIETGKAEGCKMLAGGNRLEGALAKGYFVAPTIFADVTPDSTIAQEEIFGPVLAIIRANDYDDAMRIANKVRFGLSASILTKDLSAAFKYIHEIEAGLITVNLPSAGVEYQLPFGGVKDSSSGFREQGSVAIDFYSELSTIYMKYR